jgi:hypothetical protein
MVVSTCHGHTYNFVKPWHIEVVYDKDPTIE